MKIGYILFLILGLSFVACENKSVGFLKADTAEYAPDSLEIRKNLDPMLDAIRIKNKAPWTTFPIEGVLGTPPIHYEIEEVRSFAGGGDAELFKKELSIIGGGIMYYAYDGKAPKGEYWVSIRISNEGYSVVKKDAFRFILK